MPPDVPFRIQYHHEKYGWVWSMYPWTRWDEVIRTEGQDKSYRMVDVRGVVVREWHPQKS